MSTYKRRKRERKSRKIIIYLWCMSIAEKYILTFFSMPLDLERVGGRVALGSVS
jgi:hypothetical protein